MTRVFEIPEAACVFKFVRASGPGGQHVNKASTAVELRVRVDALNLPLDLVKRLRDQQRTRMSSDGILIIQADEHRSQQRNRTAALDRLQKMLANAAIKPKKRIATKPSTSAKRRRLDKKKLRSTVKSNRKKPQY